MVEVGSHADMVGIDGSSSSVDDIIPSLLWDGGGGGRGGRGGGGGGGDLGGSGPGASGQKYPLNVRRRWRLRTVAVGQGPV